MIDRVNVTLLGHDLVSLVDQDRAKRVTAFSRRSVCYLDGLENVIKVACPFVCHSLLRLNRLRGLSHALRRPAPTSRPSDVLRSSLSHEASRSLPCAQLAVTAPRIRPCATQQSCCPSFSFPVLVSHRHHGGRSRPCLPPRCPQRPQGSTLRRQADFPVPPSVPSPACAHFSWLSVGGPSELFQ